MAITGFCGECGTARAPGARFCGNCGAPAVEAVAADGTSADGAERTSVLHRPELPEPATAYAPPQPAHGQPPYGSPAHDTVPDHGPRAHGLPPSPGPAQHWSGQAPTGPAASAGGTQPGGVPWATGGPGATGRDSVDALLGGDWAGAAIAAAAATGVMAALALISLLLLGAGDAGTHEIVAATAMLVCAAFGGDLFASDRGGFDTDGFGLGSASVGALPLTLTLAGLTVLVVVHRRRTRGAGPRDLLFQGIRTTLVLAALTLLLALVSRVQTGTDPDLFSAPGRVGASVPSSVVGAVLFAVAALGLAGFSTRGAALPERVVRVREQVRAPLLAAAAVFLLGLLAAVAGLVYTLSTEDDQLQQLGVALLALPNLALGTVLLTMGVPLRAEGSFFGLGAGASDVSADAASSTVSLLSLTERSALWWLAPVVLALVLVALAVVVVVRQHTLPAARREALRFAGCLAVLAAVAAMLLRISGSGSSSASSLFSGEGSVLFNPVVAAVVAGLWGLAAAVAAPQVATKTSGSLVQGVRRRFGTAPPPAPPTTAPSGRA